MEHLLYEHTGGFELFEMKAFETLGQASYSDYMALSQVVNYVSSFPFLNASQAAEQIKLLEACTIGESLKNFLEMNGVKVLHCDKSLKGALKAIGIEQKSSPNITRGIRHNLKKITKQSMQAQLVLGVSHILAKEHIKYDLEREDNVAITTGYEIEHLEKDIESLKEKARKITNWYTDEIPESEKIILDGYAAQVSEKEKLLKSLEDYLSEKMKILAPNLRQILGDRLCFKMIHKAGGLMNLSLYPSSTLQLLGAEKSLFRSLRMKKKTPKHGLIYQLDYLKGNIGRMCRFIATKCSLAARIDCYGTNRSDEYGKELRKMIEKKMKSSKSGKDVERTADLLTRVQKRLESAKESKAQ